MKSVRFRNRFIAKIFGKQPHIVAMIWSVNSKTGVKLSNFIPSGESFISPPDNEKVNAALSDALTI